MAKLLDVYFYEKIIGQLVQDDEGRMLFTYSTAWLKDPKASSISRSLPLQAETFTKKSCQAFFGGILPEGSNRKLIAKNLGISANNDFSMLEKIGGECAGALSFIPAGQQLNAQKNNYHALADADLEKILRELTTRPLLAGDEGIRLSLAGVQDKIAVYVENDKFSIPLDSSPSTHILKPDFGLYEGVIFNEAFCLSLARQVGLDTASAEIKRTGDINYLLIQRYDRIFSNSEKDTQKIKRIHQEDFCQALGISSTNKYQNEGGPSLKQCFNLIRAESTTPILDLNKMLNAVIFNYLIGNCDAHGKNFSFLYPDRVQLTPLYDLVSTVYYKDLSRDMAMKLGGEYKIDQLRPSHFERLAEEAGFAKPEMRKRILELIEAILAGIKVISFIHPIQEEVAQLIRLRCSDFSAQL